MWSRGHNRYFRAANLNIKAVGNNYARANERKHTKLEKSRLGMPISSKWTAQKMKFSIKDFFSKCDQIRSFQRIWCHLLMKYLLENSILCCRDGCFLQASLPSNGRIIIMIILFTVSKAKGQIRLEKSWFNCC